MDRCRYDLSGHISFDAIGPAFCSGRSDRLVLSQELFIHLHSLYPLWYQGLCIRPQRWTQNFCSKIWPEKNPFFIILPMAIISLLAFIQFTVSHHFPMSRILINSIPFILLILVAWSMQRRQSILYYLAIIDGLMLVKAACGIMGVLILKW